MSSPLDRPMWICPETGKPHQFEPDEEYDPSVPPINCGEHVDRSTRVPRLTPKQRALLDILIEKGPQDIFTHRTRRTADALVRRNLAWFDVVGITLHRGPR